MDRIEARRAVLLASDREIVRVDFGAGDAVEQRSPEDQRRGVRVPGTVGEIARNASKPPFWGLLLFKILRHLRPRQALELGTAVGLSAAYQAAALHLNRAGRLVTMEGDPTLAQVAQDSWTALGLEPVDIVVGNFLDTLPAWLAKTRDLDLAFVDGHHDEHATVRYFEQIRSRVADPALLVFDDIRWSRGMARAWRTIASQQAVSCAIDLGTVGLCVLGDAPARRRLYHIPLQVTAFRYHRRLTG